MTQTLYNYEPTHTSIQVLDDDTIFVRFGRATSNLEENTAEARWVKTTYESIIQSISQPAYAILDFTTIDSSEYNSDESNKIYLEILRDDRLKKIAVFGLHTGWELFINVFKFYAKQKLHTFETEAQAKQWIDEQRGHATSDK